MAKQNKTNLVRRVAFVSYNRIGEAGQFPNDVIKKDGLEVYISQSGHGAKWAASGPGQDWKVEVRRNSAVSVASKYDLVDMDFSYVYVGKNGGEEAIRQTRNLSADKVAYVMCSCNSSGKRELIAQIGNSSARIIGCECGGQYTLGSLVEKTLAGKN
ncbi:MAG: hypothetical protein WCK90_04875 [archaeon]